MKLFKLLIGMLIISFIYLSLLWNQEFLLPEKFIDTIHERELDPTALFYTESEIPSQVYFGRRLMRRSN